MGSEGQHEMSPNRMADMSQTISSILAGEELLSA